MSLFKRPDPGALKLWALFCLLPIVLFGIATRDVWLLPRTVLTGVVGSKSFQTESRGNAMMHFRLTGQPYDFSALIKMVYLPEERPSSSYDELKQGSTAAVTVYRRDVAGEPVPDRLVPVLRIDQAGNAVFLSGELFFGGIIGPVLIIVALGALAATTIRAQALAKTPVGRFLHAIDSPAQRVARHLNPVRDFDSIERKIRYDRAVTFMHFAMILAFGLAAMSVYLLFSALVSH